MSLWSDSLENCLSGYDGVPYYGPAEMKRPFFIFAHLAMKTPRTWWELFLGQGEPQKDHVGKLRQLFDDLKKHTDLQGRINYSLLVAMAFLDDEAKPSFGTLPNQHSIEEYIAGAQKVLAERPDVKRLAEVVTEIANALL
jgi:hypothetical protein